MPAHPVDTYVGSRIRARRIMLSMNQETLGKAVGITFQQIQKYERGINRVSSSRLYDFANFMKVPISYFFEGYENQGGDELNNSIVCTELSESKNFTSRETFELVKAYYAIKDEKVRKKYTDFLRVLAN